MAYTAYGRENLSPNRRVDSPGKTSPGKQTPKSNIAARYLDTLNNDSPSEPLKTRSPAKVNSSMNSITASLSPTRSPAYNNRSPSPTKHLSSLDYTDHQDLLLRHSSNAHLRTLASSELQNTSNNEEVIQGRLRLQRNESTQNNLASRNWMDNQRKNIQAYEYLCHIGEAKEWLEACIGEEIPAIVQLDEALRDGVILAKLTKQFAPHIVKKIFESQRLQFRHSQNINYFFQFLDEIGMPELFTFELTDLYDKKNIPKVIYCVHALGFILSSQGLAPPIGDLVGDLDFTEDELKNTQRGLDAAGVSMPNFKGMNRHFNEPEPEPEEEPEPDPRDLSAQFSDEITKLQAISRGGLFRYEFDANKYILQRSQDQITKLQAQARGMLIRKSIQYDNDCLMYLAEPEIILLQSLARGNLLRDKMSDILFSSESPFSENISRLQALIRGQQVRIAFDSTQKELARNRDSFAKLQSIVRANCYRVQFNTQQKALKRSESQILRLQAIARAHLVRRLHVRTVNDLQDSESWMKSFQAAVRRKIVTDHVSSIRKAIFTQSNIDQATELQSIARGGLVRCDLQNKLDVLEDETDRIVVLQSVFRAGRTRGQVSSTVNELQFAEPFIVRLQSTFRGLLVRYAQDMFLEELEEESESVTELQAAIRGYLVRNKFDERMEYFRKNMSAVIKIQSFVRAKKQGDAYKSLLTGKNPPLSTVKNFVHLLNDNDLDFEEEVDLEKCRKKVVDKVHHNEMLEQFIQQLDVKIALLLKNKISLDEVIRHRNKGFSNHMDLRATNDIFDLKALNKSSRKRLELYQGLFYILQTQPIYLAKLLSRLGENAISDKESKDVESLVMKLFSNSQKPREEFFLLKLIGRSIKEELDRCDSPKTFVRSNYIWWRLVAAVNRGTKDRKILRSFLERSVTNITENEDCDLESDPLTIYRALINHEEISTGHRSSRNPNIPVEQAIQDPETRAKFVENLQRLREYSSDILSDVEENVDSIPYHIRYISREIYLQAKRRFMADMRSSHTNDIHLEDKFLTLIGHVVFNNYLNPAIVSSDHYGIVRSALNPMQTKNLTEITRVLSQMATLRPFSKQNVFLQPLNDYVKSGIERMRCLFKKLIDIPDPEQQYDMNMFDDLSSHQRPTLLIKTSDIFALHSLVSHELAHIAPNKDDSLHCVVKELGSLPNDATEILNIARFTEVKLDLNPSYSKFDNEEAEVNMLFVATKRLMIYVLRVQSGANLLDILVSPMAPEHEDKYRAILKEEQIERKRRKTEFQESSLGDLTKLTYRELKLLTLEKVIELESYGRISRENNYQEILDSIAYDIRTKNDRRLSRKKEMEHIVQTIASLEEKEAYLQNQLKTYNDYIEQAMNTLQTKTGEKKKKLVLPFTRQYFHQRDLQKSGKAPCFGSYKYSASHLLDKGIMIAINGYADRQLSQVMFTFSSDQVGVFNIEASYGSIALPEASIDITLDELLGEQYNNKQHISFFDDMATFNTNLLLHFIFKKFYNDGKK